MTGVDTNVLVRYFVEDDRDQTDRVRRFLAGSRAAGEPVYISSIVLCETVWVLRSVFGKSRSEVLSALEHLLNVDVFQIEQPDAVRRALQMSRKGRGDFADHLIGQLNRENGCRFTVTFDRDLQAAPEFSAV